jgi:hypothetical protein
MDGEAIATWVPAEAGTTTGLDTVDADLVPAVPAAGLVTAPDHVLAHVLAHRQIVPVVIPGQGPAHPPTVLAGTLAAPPLVPPHRHGAADHLANARSNRGAARSS